MKIIDIGAVFHHPVASIFKSWKPIVIAPHTLEECEKEVPSADMICFGGGADVSPALYGQPDMNGVIGGCIAARDRFERSVFEIAIHYRIPMLGICRGSQFLCVMSGGQLFQHINGHGLAGTHTITTLEGFSIDMTSTHHQMMYPGAAQHELLGWCEPNGKLFIGARWHQAKMPLVDAFYKAQEVVYFPKTNALCIQGHPEYLPENHPAQVYTRQLVEQKLFGTRVVINMEAA